MRYITSFCGGLVFGYNAMHGNVWLTVLGIGMIYFAIALWPMEKHR